MKNNLTAFVLSLFVFSASAAYCGEIYKWTDENGKVHYGDTKPKHLEAESVTPEVNTMEGVETKRVVMYATSWCGYCRKARKYFSQHAIAYTEYDIEKDRSAKQRYDALGANGVPVILVGDQRMNGFSEQRMKRMLQADEARQ